MKTQAKMLSANFLVASFVLVAAVAAILVAKEASWQYDKIAYQTVPVIEALDDIKSGTLRVVASTSEYGFIQAEKMHIAEGDFEDDHAEEEEEGLIEEGSGTLSEALERYHGLLVQFDRSETHYFEMKEVSDGLVGISEKIIELKESGFSGKAVLELKEEFEDSERSMIALVDHRIKSEKVALTVAQASVTRSIQYLFVTLGAMVLIAFATAALLATFQSRHVLDPLKKLKAAADDYRAGHEDSAVDHQSSDEFGELAEAWNDMTQAINERTRALEIARDEANLANSAKSEFLANISHELRTPMHAILSFAEIGTMKVETAPPDKTLRYFENIKSSGERLLFLLNDLLELSKLEAGQMEFTFEDGDIKELLSQARGEFAALAKKKDIELVLDFSNEPADAWCDLARLNQVVGILLSSAIKFSHEGKPVRVSLIPAVRSGAEGFEITVSDQGIGIPEGEVEKIFDKFVQSSTTNTGAGGTGLGLAICKEIVEHHKGEIWARTNEFGGADIGFFIPAGQRMSIAS